MDLALENWEAQILFFLMECFEEDLNSTKQILKSLEHPIYKMYVNDLYRSLLRNFLKKDCIDKTDLSTIDVSNSSNFSPIETMYFGAKTELLMTSDTIDQTDLHNFRLRALEFYIELSIQIKKRFNFCNPVLNFLKDLNPEVAVSGEMASIISPATKYFPGLVKDVEQLNAEWRLLADLIEVKNY